MIYKSKNKCSACEACSNICPVNAISFDIDESGSAYPTIDKEKCIECNLCKKVCITNHIPELKKPISVKVAVLKSDRDLYNSSSGAIFFGIAKKIIDNKGVVFGASYTKENGKIMVVHKQATTLGDVKDIQGSKYARSHINDTFRKVKECLEDKKEVLFTGTPCQVAGLYNYLGKEYKSLYTADLVCHGVPEQKLFNNYIEFLGKKNGGEVEEYCFRDKKYGWGLTGSFLTRKKNNKLKKTKDYCMLSSYYGMFIKGYIYRENCYDCDFAREERISDITMADYWGIYKEHPEILKENGGDIDPRKGISCAIINSEKGKKLLYDAKNSFILFDSSYEKIKAHNGQLNKPSQKPEQYEMFYGSNNKDYQLVDQLFWKTNSKISLRIQYLKKRIKESIPHSIKKPFKRLIK